MMLAHDEYPTSCRASKQQAGTERPGLTMPCKGVHVSCMLIHQAPGPERRHAGRHKHHNPCALPTRQNLSHTPTQVTCHSRNGVLGEQARQEDKARLMAVALSSSRELCAGLQSTACTLPAPCTMRFKALQPPLVSVRQVSALLMSSTCRQSSSVSSIQYAVWAQDQRSG